MRPAGHRLANDLSLLVRQFAEPRLGALAIFLDAFGVDILVGVPSQLAPRLRRVIGDLLRRLIDLLRCQRQREVRDIGRCFVTDSQQARVYPLVELPHIGSRDGSGNLGARLVDKRYVIAQLRGTVPSQQRAEALFDVLILLRSEIHIAVQLNPCQRVGVVVAELHRGAARNDDSERQHSPEAGKAGCRVGDR